MEQTTLYYRSGTSDKEYQASVRPEGNGYVVTFAFGRRGSAMQTGRKTPTPIEYGAAKILYERLLGEKMAKGYTVGADGTPYAHSAQAGQVTGIVPQLLNPVSLNEVSSLLRDPYWWLQQKYDGERRLIRKQGADIISINRRGLQVALPEPWLEDGRQCPLDFLLDGEAVGDTLYAFDLLTLGDKDLREDTCLERYLSLMHLLTSWDSRCVRLVKTVCTDGEKQRFFEELQTGGAEGAVFRQIDQPYTEGRPARGGPARKYKFVDSASFIVSRINEQRSVSLTLLDDGVAKSAGNVTIPPNHPLPEIGQVVEVRYLYAFRESGHVCQPVYLGARAEITQEECSADQLKYKAAPEELAA